eukprot:gene14434-biopygen14891
MLFAQEPTVPPDLKGRPALEFDKMPKSDADTRVADPLTRADVVKRQMIHAGCNLEVAQHRDQQRYQQHKSAILRVVAVKDTGVVTLEDRTGLKEKTTLQCKEEHHWGAKKRADLGTVSGLKQLLGCIMPGSWHDGHLTRLSRKYAKQKEKSRSLRSEGGVPAMSKEVREARGEVQKMKRSQVKEASLLDWRLELVMTVPVKVKRLSVEVDWSEIQRVWDPWACTGVIGKVLGAANPHLSVLNNDWIVHLGWKEARDALQHGNYQL